MKTKFNLLWLESLNNDFSSRNFVLWNEDFMFFENEKFINLNIEEEKKIEIIELENKNFGI